MDLVGGFSRPASGRAAHIVAELNEFFKNHGLPGASEIGLCTFGDHQQELGAHREKEPIRLARGHGWLPTKV